MPKLLTIVASMVAVSVIAGAIYYSFYAHDIQNEVDETEEDDEEGDEEVIDKGVVFESKKNVSLDPQQKEVDDSEQEGLKQSYEDAKRLAQKYQAGGLHVKAAEKYTEAIDLSSQIPSASKSLLVLYNNRSAMYERAKKLDEALSDITVVITLDPGHLKGRGRRARILELQGKFKESLLELLFVNFLEERKGQAPTGEKKIHDINKLLSGQHADDLMISIRASKGRELPTKSYCKMYLETFPTIHVMRVKLEGITKNQHESLPLATFPENIDSELDLAWIDITNGNIKEAFVRLRKFYKSEDSKINDFFSKSEDKDENIAQSISSLLTIIGTDFHLRCNFNSAIEMYTKAMILDKNNIDPVLKLASIHLELGDFQQSKDLYDSLCASHTGINLAWSLMHRASLWISRDRNGDFRSDAVPMGLSDLVTTLEITADKSTWLTPLLVESAKAARFNALMKIIQVISQIKPQCGIPPTQEEHEQVLNFLKEAKGLFPKSQMLMFSEAEQRSAEENFDGAHALCDECLKQCDRSDGYPYVMRASIFQRQFYHLFAALQEGKVPSSESSKLNEFKDNVEMNFNKALSIEPNCLEAYMQLAHFKMQFNLTVEALELMGRALSHARYRDEAIEVCTSKFLLEAQIETTKLLVEHGLMEFPGQ